MRYFPVRLVVLFAVFFALYIGLQILPMLVPVDKHGPFFGLYRLAGAVFLSGTMIVCYRLTVRLVEKRRADELGGSGLLSGVAGGTVLGLGLFAAVYAVIWSQSYAHVSSLAWSPDIERALAVSIASGIGEEIVFRGIFFRIFEQGFGTLAALIASSAIFGLLHGLNPGATWWSTLSIALEAGALLGAAYAATRSLWLPIGFHFGWNFAEGGIFSAAVSGNAFHGLVNGTISGPSSWTGGAFGPEASVVALAFCVPAFLVLLAVAVRRGNWQPPRMQMRLTPAKMAA